MTAPLSADLRERVVRAVESGSSARAAARRFAVSASAAVKLLRPKLIELFSLTER